MKLSQALSGQLERSRDLPPGVLPGQPDPWSPNRKACQSPEIFELRCVGISRDIYPDQSWKELNPEQKLLVEGELVKRLDAYNKVTPIPKVQSSALPSPTMDID